MKLAYENKCECHSPLCQIQTKLEHTSDGSRLIFTVYIRDVKQVSVLAPECTNIAPIKLICYVRIYKSYKGNTIFKNTKDSSLLFYLKRGNICCFIQFMLGVATRDLRLLFKEATTLNSIQFPSMISAGKLRSKNAAPKFPNLGLFRGE